MGYVSQKEYLFLNTKALVIYTLPQIHKNSETPPGRQIGSGCGSILEPLGQYMDLFIKDFVPKTSCCIRDNMDMINQIEYHPVSPVSEFLCTLDVESLYTNIPQAEGLLVIEDIQNSRPRPHAYVWDKSEDYLFKSMVAWAMRSTLQDETFIASSVELCNITKRISFWFVVINTTDSSVVPESKVEMAIRKQRNRINSAFLLNDDSLEFVQIIPTLSGPLESSITVWLVVFGVIFSLALVAVFLLIVSTIRRHREKKKMARETEDSEGINKVTDGIENRVYSDLEDLKCGQVNGVYVPDDSENVTPM
ncbi:collectrin-like [Lissotriton helveticus]